MKTIKGLLMVLVVMVSMIGCNKADQVETVKEVKQANEVVYTVDKVDGEKYHAVSGNESVEFTLNDVDGMITGVGDKVTVTYKDEMGENVKVIEVVN